MDESQHTGPVAPPTNALARWVMKRWYAKLLLFPILVAAILLAGMAPSRSWWLMVGAVILGAPALTVVLSASPMEPIRRGFVRR